VSLSGTLLDQLKQYYPDFYHHLLGFLKQNEIELISSTYYHSGACKYSIQEFSEQITLHSKKNYTISGRKSKIFSNSDLTYESTYGKIIFGQHFNGVILDGPVQYNKERSSDFIYQDPLIPSLRLILRNERYSTIFSSAKNLNKKKIKVIVNNIIAESNHQDTRVILIHIDMETFGNQEKEINRVFHLLKDFIYLSLDLEKIDFMCPSEILKKQKPYDIMTIPESIPHSRGTFKNSEILRKEALRYLYSLEEIIKKTNDPDLLYQWRVLQSRDHILHISEDEEFIPGNSSQSLSSGMHERFQNYMNALSCIDIHTHNILQKAFI
jgi:alpha-amylase